MTWPGGKNGSGVYQRIINHMPPHDIYIEAFCGSGAVLRNKLPAIENFAIDRDEEAIKTARGLSGYRADIEWLPGECGITFLEDHGDDFAGHPQTLIYCDPPYPHETRTRDDMYAHEMGSDDHRRLLELLCNTQAMVMISGYRCDLYDARLKHWRRDDYQTMTRGGVATESLWMNFPEPVSLHDYSFLGENYRERERIRRKKERFRKRFAAMDRLERLAIMDVITGGSL